MINSSTCHRWNIFNLLECPIQPFFITKIHSQRGGKAETQKYKIIISFQRTSTFYLFTGHNRNTCQVGFQTASGSGAGTYSDLLH